MLVEPGSLCWVGGRMVEARDGPTWAVEFARFSALSGVVRDDGSGLGKGLKLERARRRAAGQPDLEDSLDIFHTFREGGRALRTTWRGQPRPGASRGGPEGVGPVGPCGRIADGPRHTDKPPVASGRGALGSGDGRREGLEAEPIRLRVLHARRPLQRSATGPGGGGGALPHLSGPAWAKTRRLLRRRESFTFLDQAQRRLAELGLNPDVLSALLDLEGLQRQAWRLSKSTPGSAATRAWALARTVQLSKAEPHWQDLAGRVREVLRGVWRASSLVECINSVARMHQGRHRKMTQGLLDLKRLYWNLHPFRAGHRKDQTPYGLLGLKLPALSFWEFLRMTPEELRKQLSATDDVP